MKFHEISGLFPMMSDEALADLAESIREQGLLEDIRTFEGQILDGRNRFLACGIALEKPRYREFDGNRDQAIDMAYAWNDQRRHMNDSQRALVGAKLANMKQGGDRTKQQSTHGNDVTLQEAAERVNSSRTQVARARAVMRDGVPEMEQAIEAGKLHVRPAYDLLEEPAAVQRKIATAENPSSAIKTLKEKRSKQSFIRLHDIACNEDSLDEHRRSLAEVRGWLTRKTGISRSEKNEIRQLTARLDCVLNSKLIWNKNGIETKSEEGPEEDFEEKSR